MPNKKHAAVDSRPFGFPMQLNKQNTLPAGEAYDAYNTLRTQSAFMTHKDKSGGKSKTNTRPTRT